MILESNQKVKPWRRVPKPLSKYTSQTTTRIVSKPPAPPVSPKRGGKVYLYVYDSEPESASVPQYYTNPHSTRQESLESQVAYPYEKEKKQRDQKQNLQNPTPQQGRTGRERVRDQGRKFNKGYKVLAEVTPKLRSSSRGGKMFVKQRKRMDKFTMESQKQQQDENQNYENQNGFFEGATDARATPWHMAAKSPAAVQYITSKKLSGCTDKGRRMRDPLGFMPRPPDYWRAKVEQNFPNGPMAPVRVSARSIGRHRSGWNPSAEIDDRPESAPPMESPTYDDDAGYDPNAIYDESNQGDYSQYGIPPRPASAALPSATLHFNARQYYTAPHRRQGLRKGWNVYTTVPYAHRDFNAKPKGWHRHF